MDITSYLLGKNSAGGGGSAGDYFTLYLESGSSNRSGILKSIKSIPKETTIHPSITSLAYAFKNCSLLLSVPQLNTERITSFQNMFDGCNSLTTVPVFDTTNITIFGNMFSNCFALSNESLDNILQMCINANSYTGTKTLVTLGINSAYYPSATIEALPHYQAFIDAGWTIGY